MATIAQNLAALRQARSDIASAITTKGGTVAQGDGLSDFATDIGTIPSGVDTSSDTVTASTLKSGYTAHNAAGQRITGTMLSQPTTVTAETLAQGITAYNASGERITGSAVVALDWGGLQRKVRGDDVADISIGDLYTCLKGSGGLTWKVIGKNIDTPANPSLSHALTLRVRNVLPDDLEFDAPEAFYACQTSALSAGTYYYRSYYEYHEFTLTQSVPIGGQLVCTDNATLQSYASGSSTTPIETVSVTMGSSGTYLGEVANNKRRGNFNAEYRRQYGSNDWKESAIRQWLNSNKPAGQWWEPQNPWDRPPAYAETLNGFMYDLDLGFLAVIGKTQVTTKYFDTSTGSINGTYTTEDYFFLMSTSQVSSDYSGEGTKYTPYSDNASRKLYKKGSPYSSTTYFLRSPSSTYSGQVFLIWTNGSVETVSPANHLYGVAPACNII